MLPSEHVVRDAMAKWGTSSLTSGRLFLTNQRLVFEANLPLTDRDHLMVGLADLAAVEPAWTMLLGVLPLAPNAIRVRTRDGESRTFTVWGRSAWIAAINAEIAAVRKAGAAEP